MYHGMWGAGGMGSNSGFAECYSRLFGYSRQSGLHEVPWSADLEQESTAKKVSGEEGVCSPGFMLNSVVCVPLC